MAIKVFQLIHFNKIYLTDTSLYFTFDGNLKTYTIMNLKLITFKNSFGIICHINPQYIKYIEDYGDSITAYFEDEKTSYHADITYEEFLKLLND